MVLECIKYYGVGSLAFINGNMNSQKDIQTLVKNIWQVFVKHLATIHGIFKLTVPHVINPMNPKIEHIRTEFHK